VALPFLPAYSRLNHQPADFPVAHSHQSRILSLPIFPEMTPAHLDTLERAIREFEV
jgi:dTDP-4-amino-4,6-dideoxygalactose transaminase